MHFKRISKGSEARYYGLALALKLALDIVLAATGCVCPAAGRIIGQK